MKGEKALMRSEWATCPDNDIPLITETQIKSWNGSYTETITNCVYIAEVTNNILIVTMFLSNKTPVLRIFLGGYDWFNEKADSLRPSTATALYLKEWGKAYFPLDGADEIITDYINSRCYYLKKAGASGLDFLGQYQQKIRENNLSNKYDRIRNEIDNAMLEIKPLPKAVFDWIDKVSMSHARYIFYDYKSGKKQMQGYCTHCHKDVLITKPKHNTNGNCPSCKSKVKLVARGRYKVGNTLRDNGSFAYIQKTSSGVCVRVFDVSIYHDIFERTIPKYDVFEVARYFYDKTEGRFTKHFEYGQFRNTDEYRFCNIGYASRNEPEYIYPNNLKEVAKSLNMPYMPLDLLARQERLKPKNLIGISLKYPCLEYLIKLKLFKLASQTVFGGNMTSINLAGKNLKEILNIGKEDITILQKINPSDTVFEIYKLLKNQGSRIITADLKNLQAEFSNTNSFKTILKYVSLTKAINYIRKQYVLGDYEPNGTYYSEEYYKSQITGDYSDYLSEAQELDYNLTNSVVLFPKDLKLAHDTATELTKLKSQNISLTGIEELFAKLNSRYGYQSKEFLIRPIVGLDELISEGNILDHCVARYAKSHIQGDCVILLVRKVAEPNTAFYTLELYKSNEIAQCRGYKNCNMTEEVQEFINKWHKNIVLQSTAKKRKAG